MATPTNIQANLRDAEDRFLNQFNKFAEGSVFDNMVLEVDGKKGFAKFAHVFSNATYKKLVDEAEAAGLLTGNYEISTDTWKNPIRIQRDTLEEAEAIIGTEFRQVIDMLAKQSVQNRDQELTNLLVDNGNDVLGSAFFANAGAIPNSSQTIDNIHVGTGVTVATVTADFYSALQLFAEMKNAAGEKYYSSAGLGLGVTIMYPPALESVMQETFATQLTGGGNTNTLFNKAKLVANALLTDANDWFVFVDNPIYPALVIAPAGEPELQNNVPTTGGTTEESVILTDSYLFAGRDKFATGYGSRYSVVNVQGA